MTVLALRMFAVQVIFAWNIVERGVQTCSSVTEASMQTITNMSFGFLLLLGVMHITGGADLPGK